MSMTAKYSSVFVIFSFIVLVLVSKGYAGAAEANQKISSDAAHPSELTLPHFMTLSKNSTRINEVLELVVENFDPKSDKIIVEGLEVTEYQVTPNVSTGLVLRFEIPLCLFSMGVREVTVIMARPTVDYESEPYKISISNSHIPSYSVPPYCPDFWNDWNDKDVVQKNNNCYNYSNNRRTDTLAQPGRASVPYLLPITCENISSAALADGLLPLPASGVCPGNLDKIALVVAPCEKKYLCHSPLFSRNDFHWYRQGSDGMWSHKPGIGLASNIDNSGKPISNPETADRTSFDKIGGQSYSEFCGYFCSRSDFIQGEGHENIQ